MRVSNKGAPIYNLISIFNVNRYVRFIIYSMMNPTRARARASALLNNAIESLDRISLPRIFVGRGRGGGKDLKYIPLTVSAMDTRRFGLFGLKFA